MIRDFPIAQTMDDVLHINIQVIAILMSKNNNLKYYTKNIKCRKAYKKN